MLAKCLNPQCTARFRYLWEGRLFRIDFSEARRRKIALAGVMPVCTSDRERPIEHFWLCSSCAASMTIEVSEAGDVRLKSIEQGARKPAAAEAPMRKLVHAS